jgi:hypothetical protein
MAANVPNERNPSVARTSRSPLAIRTGRVGRATLFAGAAITRTPRSSQHSADLRRIALFATKSALTSSGKPRSHSCTRRSTDPSHSDVSPGPTRTDAERRAEEALLAGDESDGTIAGFTKLEWSCIQTPARYLGNEVGAVHKDWDDAEVRFTMAYPEIYEVGASNLGHVVLYTILNNQPGMLCDRAYLPGDDMLQLLKSKNRDLFAVESKRPLKHFDALGMSLAYELGAVNVLEMMHLSGSRLRGKSATK